MPSLSRVAPTVTVRVNGTENLRYQLLTCGRYSGARPLDFATFEVTSLDYVNRPIFAYGPIGGLFDNAIVSIESGTRSGGIQQLHYGRISAMEARINPRGDMLIVHSRLDDHLFGSPVDKAVMGVRSHSQPETQSLLSWFVEEWDEPIVFNPMFEGMPTPNRGFIFARAEHDVLIDPRSMDPATLAEDRARATPDGFPSGFPAGRVGWWTLAQAAFYLCKTLNPSEIHVRNPSLDELESVLGTDQYQLRNHRVVKGQFLPQALDALLKPHGYTFRVELVSQSLRSLKVYERGAGSRTVNTKLQPFGERLDTIRSNVAEMALNYDGTAQTFNKLSLLGGPWQVEVSILLRPGWEEQYDTQYALSTYNIDEDSFKDSDAVQQAWRRFVANEGGTYTGTREWFDEAPGFDTFITGIVNRVRRRRTYPTITQDPFGGSLGRTHGRYLEWWDPDEGQSGAWKLVGDDLDEEGYSWQPLQEEIGVWFSSPDVCSRFMEIQQQHGIEHLALRLTCVIRSDERMRHEIDETGILIDDRKEVLDAGESYSRTFVNTEPAVAPEGPNGLRASEDEFIGGSALADLSAIRSEVDDRDRIASKAVELIDQYNAATIEGTITIEGIDWNFDNILGGTVREIDGRDFELVTTPPGKASRYPTCVGVEFNIQDQRTRLRLETLRTV